MVPRRPFPYISETRKKDGQECFENVKPAGKKTTFDGRTAKTARHRCRQGKEDATVIQCMIRSGELCRKLLVVAEQVKDDMIPSVKSK